LCTVQQGSVLGSRSHGGQQMQQSLRRKHQVSVWNKVNQTPSNSSLSAQTVLNFRFSAAVAASLKMFSRSVSRFVKVVLRPFSNSRSDFDSASRRSACIWQFCKPVTS